MPTTAHVPLILIRGFGGLDVDDERRVAYQGFNDGTVYPHKRGENYIYEGLHPQVPEIAVEVPRRDERRRLLPQPIADATSCPDRSTRLNPGYFTGDRVIIDPGTALALVTSPDDPRKSLWVFRYYDLDDRSFEVYGKALVRLIDFVRDLTVVKTGNPKPPVNIIAHSMGGLIVREAVQCTFPALRPAAPTTHQQDRDARHAASGHLVSGHPRLEVRRGGARSWSGSIPRRRTTRTNPWSLRQLSPSTFRPGAC